MPTGMARAVRAQLVDAMAYVDAYLAEHDG
jgi:hypothetical protein